MTEDSALDVPELSASRGVEVGEDWEPGPLAVSRGGVGGRVGRGPLAVAVMVLRTRERIRLTSG